MSASIRRIKRKRAAEFRTSPRRRAERWARLFAIGVSDLALRALRCASSAPDVPWFSLSLDRRTRKELRR